MNSIKTKKKANGQFFGFWDSKNNSVISEIQKTQIILWAKSILFFHPETNLWLISKKNVIPPNLINLKGLKIIYLDDLTSIFEDTPLSILSSNIFNGANKAEQSDLIRLALLYRFGGTWLDIDDVVVRKFPTEKNIVGTFLWENNKTKATYWGSTFNLVNGSLVSNKYKNFGFHIQNDPLVNWEKGNKFLLMWMNAIKNSKSCDWGQNIPTEIIRKDIKIIKECEVTLLPQHHLLLHPAFGNNKQFGNPNCKGPMFPSYDLRITGKVNYDDMITKGEFWEVAKQTLEKHDYCCVKNSKNTGIMQCNEGKDKRWFIGNLCDWKNIDNILDKFNLLNLQKNTTLPFYYIHIPKTLGTTIYKSLLNSKYKDKFCNFYGIPCKTYSEYRKKKNNINNLNPNIDTLPQLDHLNLNQLLNAKLLTNNDKNNLNCIAIIRDPIEMFLSRCNFFYPKFQEYKHDIYINSDKMMKDAQFKYLKNYNGWNVTLYKITDIKSIEKWFKRMGYNIDLSIKKNVSKKKITINDLSDNDKKKIIKNWNIDYKIYNSIDIGGTNLSDISNLIVPTSTASINLEGGLGNQMFKIFCLISYSVTYNKKYIFNRNLPKINNKKIDIRNTYWNNIFKSISENTFDNKRNFKHQYNENKLYEYSEIPYFEKDVLVNGYYQNYKYFEKKYDEIINILNLNEIQNNIKNKYLKNQNTISLHFRKGDYKNLDNYIILNICYYIKAIRYVLDKDTSNCSEILCVYETRDQEEVSKMIQELQEIFTEIKFTKVSTDLQDWEQMLLMSVCRHNIIANSTFSWWSAYINKNVDKIVCYPEKWFIKPKNLTGMFPGKWKMIKNDSI